MGGVPLSEAGGVITVLVTPDALAGSEVEVSGDPYRHLFRARRLACGTRLRLVDGEGRARWGEVTSVDARHGRVSLGAPAPANEADLALELLVATPRGERASWLVEKATEVGVAAVRFLAAERAPRRLGPATLERLRRVAGAAVEQCHRARVPEVSGVHAWAELPRLLATAGPGEALALDCEGGAPGPALPVGGRVALLVGPEGGWTAAERHLLRELGCQRVSLGPRVLRIETAALVGAAWLLAFRVDTPPPRG